MTLTPTEVRAVRIQMGISTEKLGRMLGISGRTVRNWENGRTCPPHHHALAMHRMAKSTLDLVYGNGPGPDRFTMVVIASPGLEGVYEP